MILGCLITIFALIFAFVIFLLSLVFVGISITFAFILKLLIPLILVVLGVKFLISR